MNILHITAHMGGGIGKVLSAISIYDRLNKHSILCLETTKTTKFISKCRIANVDVYQLSEFDVKSFDNYDIIQIEWWHHPLMCEFLVNTLSNVFCRLVIWSHISGCNYPNIFYRFIKYADKFIFASNYSYENKTWNQGERSYISKATEVVVSSGNDFSNIQTSEICNRRNNRNGFNIGYIGHLGYDKLNSDFIKFCESAYINKNIRFFIGGDKNYGEELLRDIENSDIKDKIQVMGYIDDVNKTLSEFDVFLYPLQADHTGTAENALLEAMANGVVPIVLNQCSEKYTVKHMQTGLIVLDIYQCRQAIQWLYNNPLELKRISLQASEFVIKNFNITKTIDGLNNVYDNIKHLSKSIHDSSGVFGQTPFDWFTSCYCGDLNNISGIAAGQNKSSIHQYIRYFPTENKLKELIL